MAVSAPYAVRLVVSFEVSVGVSVGHFGLVLVPDITRIFFSAASAHLHHTLTKSPNRLGAAAQEGVRIVHSTALLLLAHCYGERATGRRHLANGFQSEENYAISNGLLMNNTPLH